MTKFAYEIRLVSWTKNDDGSLSVMDIVETSRHFAYSFVRGYLRNPDICAFGAAKPDTSLDQIRMIFKGVS
jgi:hypothetical protein